ncbi:hypothetical protein [Enterobacter bugandensis]|uniref:hypothetical protein n=1 Tax=Enterobacter bugandensis TaxID=881260 RepID=UPI0021D13C31|nr:hypothetical protein [Enterobacter bugandensis]MCU6217582.1 hypothetical protein [Enterobacter bugandensis]
MTKLRDGTLGDNIYFCLIHKNNALCGSGINSPNDKNEELSKDAMKLLESISFDDN